MLFSLSLSSGDALPGKGAGEGAGDGLGEGAGLGTGLFVDITTAACGCSTPSIITVAMIYP